MEGAKCQIKIYPNPTGLKNPRLWNREVVVKKKWAAIRYPLPAQSVVHDYPHPTVSIVGYLRTKETVLGLRANQRWEIDTFHIVTTSKTCEGEIIIMKGPIGPPVS